MSCRKLTKKGRPCTKKGYEGTNFCYSHWSTAIGGVLCGNEGSYENAIAMVAAAFQPELPDFLLESIADLYSPAILCDCGAELWPTETTSVLGSLRNATHCAFCGHEIEPWVFERIKLEMEYARSRWALP